MILFFKLSKCKILLGSFAGQNIHLNKKIQKLNKVLIQYVALNIIYTKNDDTIEVKKIN